MGHSKNLFSAVRYACLVMIVLFGLVSIIGTGDGGGGGGGGGGNNIVDPERWSINNQNVVLDRQTGLEWYHVNSETNHNNATDLVNNLNVAGGRWRMPTRAELKSLYAPGISDDNITPLLIDTTGDFVRYPCVWSGELCDDTSNAWGFHFFYGDDEWWGDRRFTAAQVLAVR